MRVAIMGAMIEEITPLLEYIGEYKEHKYADNTFYEAKYKGLDLIIAYSKIGKVFSALTASTLIEKFGASKLLFTGVAGAINENLKVGDLIVATKLCQHDLDIVAFGHPYGFVPEGKLFIDTNTSLREIAKSVSDELNIKLYEGVIATGDQFIASPQKKEWIQKTFHADAIEMEGASVAVVCDALNVDFFILRSISDAADMDAGFDFDKFLESSAKQSANFIIKMLERLI